MGDGDVRMESVAIVGMGCRFPGAPSIAEYWRVVSQGIEAIAPLSIETLLAAGRDPDVVGHVDYVRAAAMLDGIAAFDAAFFGFTPNQAALLDPQHRLFIECAWEAMEDAACDPDDDTHRTGVFAGAGYNRYKDALLSSGSTSPVADLERLIANDGHFLTPRTSYLLGLRGPSLTIQTACSTSLVALHVACQSLVHYECDTALAGGVTIRLPHVAGYRYLEGGIVSPDGHCRAFDARAAGTVFGSGVGVVVLKRLEDALQQGYRIRAVVRGSAVNNDGSDKVGFTAPSIAGQADVIREAHANADVDPQTIGYVETHGTATRLGDPIEIAALSRAFGDVRREHPCWIGSVKTNVGHLDTAAGVAGVIKTALALEHGVIPPSLHFETPNPEIGLEKTPFGVNTQLREWPSAMTPRRAGVSSFGIGGTNAHVVLEEAPATPPSSESRHAQLLVWSGKTPAALEATAANLQASLAACPDANLADVAWTLQVGRRRFPHRAYVVGRSGGEAASLLSRSSDWHTTTAPGRSAMPVFFMCPGQGTQYAGMTRGLHDDEPIFREVVDQCAQLLEPYLGHDIREVLYPTPAASSQAAALIQQTAYAQPALFVVEYAIAQLWCAWGVRPDAVVGHSLGELVAACLAGVFSLADALALIAARGQLMQQQPPGAMTVVLRPAGDVRPLLSDGLSIAAVNGPLQCVVSGPVDEIAAVEAHFDVHSTRRLKTSHAFHSGMMDPVVAPFRQRVAQCTLHPPALPVVSNVSGAWLTEAEAVDPAYWVRQLRQPVRFDLGLDTLRARESRAVFLEVGPGQALARLARASPSRGPASTILSSMALRPDSSRDELPMVLDTLGQLWVAGVPVDWRSVHRGERRHRLSLPTYPFERTTHWAARTDAPSILSARTVLDRPDESVLAQIARQRDVIAGQIQLLQNAAPRSQG